MKKISIITAAIICMLMDFLPVSARNADLVSKEKKTHNQYTVSDGDRLVIDNVFGKVHINTWDKNEITIDITVTVKAKTEVVAQEILDRISFVMSSDQEGGHKVFCKTVLESARHNNESSSMTIDYTINAPKKNAIDITDKYGDVYLGDFSGKMRMNVSYGGLDMQTITGDDKHVKVAFGSVIVSSIESGMFDVSYSDISINKAKDIDVINKYGKLEIEDVQNLKIDQRYGNVEIGSVSQIEGGIDYADLEIDKLYKNLELTLKYCGRASVRAIGHDVGSININAHYSNVDFRFAEGANLAIDVATSYSSLKGSISGQSFEQVDLNNTRYKAKVGKGEGNMIVNAHYSNISFK